MRQVFSSQRLENVEAVAELLRKEGIEVKIENGRGWRGHRRGNFSYDQRKPLGSMPSVWIIRAEDQPRGRQLLRELGLLESSRDPGASYLPPNRQDDKPRGGGTNAKRIKLGLLALIAVGIALIAFTARRQAPEPDAPAPAPAAPTLPTIAPAEAITELQVYRADVPTALAIKLIGDALAQRAPAIACVSVAGADPAPAVLQAFADGETRLHPASACPDKTALALAIGHYMTDGSGSGELQLEVGDSSRTLRVERNGTTWTVLGER